MGRLQFSGHNSFICKQFWLKKGYDFLHTADTSFNSENAVIELGIGKNMVAAVRYWLIAFGIYEPSESINSRIQRVGISLFDDENGWDPYLEDINSIWLLHYFLVVNNHATIYSQFFNEFAPIRPQFDSQQLLKYLERFCNEQNQKVSPNTLKRDIQVFIQSYQPASTNIKEIEDSYAGLLYELNLLQVSKNNVGDRVLRCAYGRRDELAEEVILFSILDQLKENQSVLSLNYLLSSPNTPGRVFGLTPEGLLDKIMLLTEKYDDITYSETAGNKVLQLGEAFWEKDAKWNVLEKYYEQKY